MLSNDLATRQGMFIKEKAELSALISVICDGGHSVKTLMESDLEMMVGEGYHNLRMRRMGTMETAHAFIEKNSLNDNICLVFNYFHMASTIHFAGNYCFFHEWTQSFNTAMGVPNDKVLPEFVNVYMPTFTLQRGKMVQQSSLK